MPDLSWPARSFRRLLQRFCARALPQGASARSLAWAALPLLPAAFGSFLFLLALESLALAALLPFWALAAFLSWAAVRLPPWLQRPAIDEAGWRLQRLARSLRGAPPLLVRVDSPLLPLFAIPLLPDFFLLRALRLLERLARRDPARLREAGLCPWSLSLSLLILSPSSPETVSATLRPEAWRRLALRAERPDFPDPLPPALWAFPARAATALFCFLFRLFAMLAPADEKPAIAEFLRLARRLNFRGAYLRARASERDAPAPSEPEAAFLRAWQAREERALLLSQAPAASARSLRRSV